MTYNFSLSRASTGATIFFVSATTPISNINEPTIINSLSYGNPILSFSTATLTIPKIYKSLKRKAWQDNIYVSAQNEDEFLGNNYYTNNKINFKIRNTPNPQNSQIFSESRSAPTTPKCFNITYISSTMSLNLNWNASQNYSDVTSIIIYKIQKYSSLGAIILETTNITEFTKIINEISRYYQFSIQSFNKDGLDSALTTSTIFVPDSL